MIEVQHAHRLTSVFFGGGWFCSEFVAVERRAN